ncbi:cupin domain-containing protein [Stappia taiwanensis]|uniref:Cupin domain-containing protein n=1 Tax=Stappia taiwanensis TaxID=992267 RepID=A0A838XVU8_9HYPH|nr:cupin domain-containing protein [Stappia taiwanensis]MBA4612616.1 cupin domain-containing protein [Stappia taiwanensis]
MPRQTGGASSSATATPIERSSAGLMSAQLGAVDLQPQPINPDWILDGTPEARCTQLAEGSDRHATMAVWDCTAGRFNWYFGCDEAVYILEGSVTVTGPDGEVRKLTAGDTAYFPAYTWFEWHVEEYVRKVAFCHDVLPVMARLPVRILGKMTRVAERLFSVVMSGKPERTGRKAS